MSVRYFDFQQDSILLSVFIFLKTRYAYIIGLVFSLGVLHNYAQDSIVLTRCSVPITYYVHNPYGNNATFTWTITGGTIPGHTSPYTSDGADSISVIWNAAATTEANPGSLKVWETVHWPDGASCSSAEEQIQVEAWVRPKAITDTTDRYVCLDEAFTIPVFFEGKPGYRYTWKLYDKDNPYIIIEDHTAGYISCDSTYTDILIAGIRNTTGTEKQYIFEITGVQDSLDDGMTGEISTARITIHVWPKTSTGILYNNNHLIRR